MDELKDRLEAVVSALEEHASKFKLIESFDKRLKHVEWLYELQDTQNRTVITQQGAVRIAVKNIKASLEAAANSFASGMSKLSAGFTTVEDDLQVTLGYTKKEIEAMSAQEYKQKVLKPLGMDRSWQK
jgi:hypothetical protein